MRAVALSSKDIQKKIIERFVPLKVVMTYPKMPAFPLDWPSMQSWRTAYERMDGKGFTGCAVVSSDLHVQYAHTGSAMVWELFDSIAYDEKKFSAMLDRAATRFEKERKLLESDRTRGEKAVGLATMRAAMSRVVAAEGPFRTPPRGFHIGHALELFRLSGDLK